MADITVSVSGVVASGEVNTQDKDVWDVYVNGKLTGSYESKEQAQKSVAEALIIRAGEPTPDYVDQ